jgi:hypothetical protein
MTANANDNQYVRCFIRQDAGDEAGGADLVAAVDAMTKEEGGKKAFFIQLLKKEKPYIVDYHNSDKSDDEKDLPENFNTYFDTGDNMEKCPIEDCGSGRFHNKVRGRGFEVKKSKKSDSTPTYRLYDHCYIACETTSDKKARKTYEGGGQYDIHTNFKLQNQTPNGVQWPYWKFTTTRHGWKIERREWGDEDKMEFNFIMYAPPLSAE